MCPSVDTDVSDFVGVADSVESDALPPREPQLSDAQSCEPMAKGYHQVTCAVDSVLVTGSVTPYGFL